MSMRTWILPAFALALVLGAVVPATADDAQEVPSKGRDVSVPVPGAGTINCTGPIPLAVPRVFEIDGVYSGQGKVSGVSTQLSCELTADGFLITTVQGATRGGDGDQTFWEQVAGINLATGELTGSGVLTGGTGKFEGLTGSYDVVGTVDLATGVVTSAFEGTASSVGSRRRR